MNLSILPGRFAIARLGPDEALPGWAQGDLVSITRTKAQLSIVCVEDHVPDHVSMEGGWRCLKVAGPIDFAVLGVLASIAGPLYRAGVSLFAISTFDTDFILVKQDRLEKAVEALESEGHRVEA